MNHEEDKTNYNSEEGVRRSLEMKRLKIALFFFFKLRKREEDIVALFREMGMGLDGRKRGD